MLFLTDSRARGVLACFVLTLSVLCMLALAPQANAAFAVPNFSVAAAPDQAAGHPKLTVSIDPDAYKSDTTNGDDLKDITIDAPTGLMLNQSAATTKCTDSQLASDSCPAASLVGTTSLKWRTLLGGSITGLGNVYVMSTPSAANSAALGLVARPSGYKKVNLRATVSNAIPVTAPTRVTATSIPRTLQPNLGLLTPVTIDQIDLILNAQANASETGPYFTLAPSSCTPATTQATFKSYSNVTVAKSSAFTPSNCAGVPFAPTATVTPTVQTPSAATGVSANFTAPVSAAPTQNSTVSAVTANLPTGTKLNTSAINAISSLCSNSQHAAASCPSGSKIGTTSVAIPNLSTALAGDIYLMTRSSSAIGFGYVLRNTSLGVKLPLKGTASNVDTNGDGVADAVRAVASGLPQIPWSTVAFNVTSKLVVNPANSCPSAAASTQLDGWSGAAATLTNQWFTAPVNCTPDTAITSGPSGTIASSSAAFAFSSTIADSSFECSLDGGAYAGCSSPIQYSGLAQGGHEFCVRAVSGGATDPSAACQTFVVDTIAPVVTANCQPSQPGTVSCQWTVDDPTATVTCAVDGAPRNPCPNPVVVTGAGTHVVQFTASDPVGNTASAAFTFVIPPAQPPVVVITSPATNPHYTTATSVSVSWAVNGSTVVPPATTCITTNTSSGTSVVSPAGSPTTSTIPLISGPNSIAVACSNAAGTSTANLQVVPPPLLQVAITTPPNNTNTTGATILVNYTVNGSNTIPAGAVCTVTNVTTGVSQSATPGATASSTVALAMGANTIQLSCANSFGVNSATITVNRGVAPVIAITSPASGSPVATPTVNVSYVVNGGSTIPAGTTCTITNSTTGVSNASNSTITNAVALQLGSNVITLTCFNAFGSSSSTTVVNYPDGDRPIITSPANGTNTTSPTINVAFVYGGAPTVPAGSTCEITNFSTGVTTPTTSTTTNPVALAMGANSITVTCTNAFGSASATVNVNRGSVPTVTITTPAQGAIVQPGPLNVAFTVNGASTIPGGTTCTVNGASTTSALINSVTIVAGSNTITVACTNAFGVGTDVRSVGTEGAQVQITSPANNSWTSGSAINVAYTVGGSTTIPAATSCVVSNMTTGVTQSSASTSSNSVALTSGPNQISVTCTNAFGATNSTVTVNRDSTGPAIGQLMLSQTTQPGPAVLTYTATDNSGFPPNCTPPSGSAVNLVVGTNNIVVTCTDHVGNVSNVAITIVISGGGSGGLAVTITGGPSGDTTQTAPTFTWSVNQAESGPLPCAPGQSCATVIVPYINYTCTMDGSAVSCPGRTYTSPTLPPGPHTFCATAHGIYSGQTSSPACRSFNIVTTPVVPPVVDITAPSANPTNTTSSSFNVFFTVNGAASIPSGTSCVVTNHTTGVSNGASSPTTNLVALALGTNVISATCTNSAGTGTDTTVINRGEPVAVTILAPATNSWTSASETEIDYVLNGSPTIPASTLCNLSSATGTVGSTSGVSNVFPLAPGQNHITLTCSNSFGTDTDSITVNRDDTPPVIGTISLSQSTQPGPATLSYAATDNSGLAPTCTPPSGATVNLVAGANTLTVSCEDAAGNASTTTASIVIAGGGGEFDVVITSGPSGTIVSPIATFAYAASEPLTAPTPCDPGVVCIQVITTKVTLACTLDNGTPFGCPTNSNFGGSYTTPSLQPGPHTFCVRGTRVADGATAEDCRSFTYVQEPPPPPQCTVAPNGSNVICTFTLPAGHTATCAIAQYGPQPCQSGWLSPALPSGTHPIQICFNGGAGTSCWASSVTINSATVVITSPANGSTTSNTNAAVSYTTTGFVGTPSCNRPSGSSVPLTLGSNTITISCVGSNGLVASDAVSITRLPAPGFSPTFSQTYPGDAQNTTTGLTIALDNSASSNPIRTATITEPTLLQPNFAAFGSASSDQCPASSIVNTSPLSFNATNCPGAAKVGTVTLSSPDYASDLRGDIYIVQRSALPYFGVDFANPALGNPTGMTYPRIVIATTVVEPDPECTDLCSVALRFTVTGLPDVAELQSLFVVDGPDRMSANNGMLSGKLFRWDTEACDTVSASAVITSVNSETTTLSTPPALPVC